MTLQVRRLGRVEYADGLRLQELVEAAVARGTLPDQLLLLEHPPVLTLGRGGGSENVLFPPEDLERRGIDLFETGRGGDVTFHGPGQIVGYPIVNLARDARTKDVRKYVRAVEETMIRACADFGVTAERVEKLTGVWVGRDKIGAIGVRISKWITSHGFALNVATDLSYFDLIVPCGIPDRGVTSLSKECDRVVGLPEVESSLSRHAADVLEREARDAAVDQTTIAVLVRRGDGRVLCLRRAPSRGAFWQIVTGRIEAGESPAQAAARELVEETGLDVPVRALSYEHAFALEIDPSRPTFAREIVFAADVSQGEVRLCDEHDAFEWLPPAEAIPRLAHAGHRRAVKLAA